MSRSTTKGRGFTRRQFIQTAAAAAATGGAVAMPRARAAKPEGLQAPPGHTDADVILQNGKIHTMDGQNQLVRLLPD